jgi:hypothetical protein
MVTVLLQGHINVALPTLGCYGHFQNTSNSKNKRATSPLNVNVTDSMSVIFVERNTLRKLSLKISGA